MRQGPIRHDVNQMMWSQQQRPTQSSQRAMANVNGIPPLMRCLTPTPERQTGVQIPRTMYQRYPEATLPQVPTQPPNVLQHTIENQLGDFAKSLNLLINQFQQLPTSFLQPNYPQMRLLSKCLKPVPYKNISLNNHCEILDKFSTTLNPMQPHSNMIFQNIHFYHISHG